VFAFPAFPAPSRLRPSRLQSTTLGLTVALAGLLLSACFAGSAQAALISTGACNEAELSQPFLQWGDSSSYELIPGGNFDGSLSGWTLSGATQRVAGGEPTSSAGPAGTSSLALAAGSSVQSPPVCVNASYPTFRFFARSNALLSTVLVQVVYQTALGTVSLPLGVAVPGSTWQPMPPMLTGSVVGGLLTGGTAEVTLRFTALTGSSDIDDVFVDPRMK
jgi:hypothetical protein